MTAPTGIPLLRLRGISKNYPGVRALNDVSLELARGEVRALTGENGSGKSTLASVLSGLCQPDQGTVQFDGREVVLRSPADAERLGIVTISQELTLAPHLSVAENICLGRLSRTPIGLVDWRACRQTARSVLDLLEVGIDERAAVGDLEIELQQVVEIARALARDAKLLILDEATSSLSETATDRFLTIIEGLRDRGVTVLMITHRMPELYRAASNATVLRDGLVVGTVPLPETTEPTLVKMMVGRELGDYYGVGHGSPGEVVLRVEELDTLDGDLNGASFELRRGEILGVAGLVGSGKAEFAKALGGAIHSTGRIEVAGREVTSRTPRGALGAGLGYVPDDRKAAAILPQRSVAENFTVAWLDALSRFGLLRTREAKRRVGAATSRYGVRAGDSSVPIALLSGGNQQKVVIGRTFDRAGCDVVVLHEPTRGIDVAAKSDLYRLMREKVAGGGAIVVVSSELSELLGIADRIMVFHHGSVRAEFNADDVDEETVAAVAVSGTPPSSADGGNHRGSWSGSAQTKQSKDFGSASE